MTTYYNNEFMYNAGTDLLLNLADCILEKPEMESEKERFSGFLSTWEISDLLKEAEEGLPMLLKNAEQARHFFIQNPVLSVISGDEQWHQANRALNAFDRVLFIWVAASHVLKTESASFVNSAEKAYQQLTEWLVRGNDFSLLRLVPMNKWRNERVKRIPEENRFLYPWYTGLSEISDETIDLISENWSLIVSDGYNALSFVPEENRAIVWDYLNRDNGLKSALDMQNRFEKAIIKALDKSCALRLLHLSSIHTATRVAPENYSATGLLNIAYTVLTDRIEKKVSGDMLISALNSADSEKAFLAAFCGPGLSKSKRLEIFKKTEKHIKEKGFGRSDSLFATFFQWSNHSLSDNIFAGFMFSFWDQFREKAYDSIIRSEFSFLLELPFVSWFSEKGVLYQSGYLSSADSKKDIAYICKENRFNMPLLYDEDGYPLVFQKSEQDDDFNKLLSAMEEYHPAFKVCYKSTDKDMECTDIDYYYAEDIQDMLKELPRQKYEYIIVGISSSKDILEKAMSGNKPENEEDSSNIIWIIYRPEEKS